MGVKDLDHVEKTKKKHTAMFEIVDMGLINFYLGLKVEKNRLKKNAETFLIYLYQQDSRKVLL